MKALSLAPFKLGLTAGTWLKRHPGAQSYWKGSTWLDQTWFAYTGLKRYAATAVTAPGGGLNLGALADTIKHRTLAHGRGFHVRARAPSFPRSYMRARHSATDGRPAAAPRQANDTTPLNEHYVRPPRGSSASMHPCKTSAVVCKFRRLVS